MPKDVKKTPKSSNDEDNTQFDEGKVDRKMEEFLQPKLDQMQRELGGEMMKAVEAQLTAQFANFAKQLGQMGRPAVPSTPLPVKRTPPPVPPPLQTSRHVKQEDSHVKKIDVR